MQARIAVIGVGCKYPGSKTATEFWKNICSSRQQFRKMPDCRLPISEYSDPDKLVPDKTYGEQAAVLDSFDFDWSKHRIPKSTYEGTDIVHWLALDVALQMLESTKYSIKNIPKEKTGVIVGNTLTGEFTRSNTMRLRWPYVKKSMLKTLQQTGISLPDIDAFLHQYEETYKSSFAEVNEDTLAGGLSNTIPGRICNYLDLHGGGYTVDGACASSLLALITACERLEIGALDLALVGGVDISLDTFELIGFAKAGALSPDVMRVYDKRGNGFIPGEGCGFVMLKRLEDAENDKDPILAVINGWAVSSDGKGGITAPTAQGQAMAIRNTYKKANYPISDLNFIEGHGTGTVKGDRVELEGISIVFNECNIDLKKTCGITSLKSVIGHTKAAAGIGAFIKSVIAVDERVIPPTSGCEIEHDIFNDKATPLYPVLRGKKLKDNAMMKAGVSAMGFGGINSHVTLSSYSIPSKSHTPALPYSQLLNHSQKNEILVFSNSNKKELISDINKCISELTKISLAELSDFACFLSKKTDSTHDYKVAITAEFPDEFIQKTLESINVLNETDFEEYPVKHNNDSSVCVSYKHKRAAIGFLIPGQGSQKLCIAENLLYLYPKIIDSFKTASPRSTIVLDLLFPVLEKMTEYSRKETLKKLSLTENAQPAIVLQSVLYIQYLKDLGLSPRVVCGHSLGELAALYMTGALDLEEVFKLAFFRGEIMANTSNEVTNGMMSIDCDDKTAQLFCKEYTKNIVVANINSPKQTILSGPLDELEALSRTLQSKGIRTVKLSVSNAFHSPYVKNASEKILEFKGFSAKKCKASPEMISSISGEIITPEINTLEYLSDQMMCPVNFVESIKKINGMTDLLFEIGPGSILSHISEQNTVKSFPVAVNVRDNTHLCTVIGLAFTHGHSISWSALYDKRNINSFTSCHDKIFIQNPLEKLSLESNLTLSPFNIKDSARQSLPNIKIKSLSKIETKKLSSAVEVNSVSFDNLESIISALISKKTGFALHSISPSMRLLDDLNMDSIKAGELVSTVAKQLDILSMINVTQFSNSSIEEICKAFKALEGVTEGTKGDQTAWVRTFQKKWKKTQLLSKLNFQIKQTINIVKFSNDSNLINQFPEIQHIARLADFPADKAADIVVILKEERFSETSLKESHQLMLAISELLSAKSNSIASITLVDQLINPSISLSSFLASCHFDIPKITFLILEVNNPYENSIEKLLVSELKHLNMGQYVHVRYDGDIRLLPEYDLYDINDVPDVVNWSSEDVVLVTGGAKGITYECALDFTRQNNVRLALVGSSDLYDKTKNGPILKALDQLYQNKIKAEYFSCNITDKNSVLDMIDCVQEKLGKIKGVIHGAGVNSPAKIGNINPEKAWQEIQVKILGALYIANALKNNNLKSWLSMSSIIGSTGMPGNAWYAFSNQSLDRFTSLLKKQHLNIATISLAYSVWGETGMGVRMGSHNILSNMGVDAIPTELGVKYFTEFATKRAPIDHIVITSRIGGLDTWRRPNHQKISNYRFLEKIIKFEPGVECRTHVKLSLETDFYLRDHNFDGSFLFPTVFALEGMAQVVAYLLNIDCFESVSIENIELQKPIVIEEDVHRTIEITALNEEGVVKVTISTDITNFQRPVFLAQFKLNEISHTEIPKLPKISKPLDIYPKIHFYGNILFQGERFQNLDKVYKYTNDEIIYDITNSIELPAYSSEFKQDYILGSPYARDVLLQSLQLIKTDKFYLPISIKSIILTAFKSEKTLSRTILTGESESMISADITHFGNSYIEKLESYTCASTNKKTQFPPPSVFSKDELRFYFLFSKQEKEIEKRYEFEMPRLLYKKIDGFSRFSKEARKSEYISLLLDQNVIKSPQEFSYASNGKPILKNNFISISNKEDHIVIAIASFPVGCDLEKIEKRNISIWGNLFNTKVINTNGHEFTDAIYTKAWTSLEAAVKSGCSNNMITFLSDSNMNVTKIGNDFTCLHFDRVITNMILTLKINKFVDKSDFVVANDPLIFTRNDIGPKGQRILIHRFRLSFKDSNSVNQNINFSNYAVWMGMLRELYIQDIGLQMKEAFSTGEWAFFTDNSTISIEGNANVLDVIEGTVSLVKRWGEFNESFLFYFEWYHVENEQNKKLIAKATLNATWVKMISHGIGRPAPVPDFFEKILVTAVPKNNFDYKYSYPQEPKELEDLDKNSFAPLHTISVDTSTTDSNLVGNIYYSNYYYWQSKILNEYLRSHFPEIFIQNGFKSMSYEVIFSQVYHLREIMPFDKVEVRLFLVKASNKHSVFYIEYFKRTSETTEKIAYGATKLQFIDNRTNFDAIIDNPMFIVDKIYSK